MICLRCGHCCKSYFSIVVDDPQKGPIEGNLIVNEDTQCKHLRGQEPGKYHCAIHDESWYEDTPCASHGQTERNPETPCRLGAHMMKKKEMVSTKTIITMIENITGKKIHE